jgi:hypothetical protein
VCAAATAFVLVAAGARPAAGQTIVAGPTTTALTAAPGERVALPIAIDLTGAPGVSLGSFRLSLRFNPTLLKVIGTAPGAFAAPVFNTDSGAQGVVKFAGANATGATGFFTLGSVLFEALSTVAGDTLRVAFQELVAAGTFADLLPQLVVTQGTFCGGSLYGDLDGDGIVKAVDAQVVLMHAVGLPVTADTTLGDVDDDARVNPRDALIILSKVVGLDVSAFRVGQFATAACVGGAPKTVQIFPEPLALAIGDQFLARVDVRDSVGNLLAGKGLAWASSNTGVMTVDSTGKITAVANGSALLTAAVSPGVTDTLTVSVGPRHRWVVNAAGAQGQASEVGSDLYPFSTIRQALDRAADGDTVVIRYGRYSDPLTTTKQLVFLGDSTASGYPVIVVPDGVAGVITRPGRQVMRQLQFTGAKAGLTIRADTVDLASLSFVSLRGPAVQIFDFAAVFLDGVGVSGARGAGIWVDSAAGSVVDIRRSLVAGIEPDSQPLRFGDGYALHGAGIFVRADSVRLDSVSVRGVSRASGSDTALVAGVLTIGASRTTVRRSAISDVGWVGEGGSDTGGGLGMGADSAVTLDVDTVSLHRIGGEGVAIAGDTIRLANADVGEIDRALVEAGRTYHTMEVTDVAGAAVGLVVRGEDGRRSAARRVTVDQVRLSAFDPGADTVTLDSVIVRGIDLTGYTCGLELDSNTAIARVNYARFTHSGYGLGVCSKEPGSTGDASIRQSGYVAILNTVFDGPYTAIHVHADSLLIQNDSIRAVGWGIWQHPGGPRATRWLDVRNVRIGSLLYEGIHAEGVADWMVVAQSEIAGTQAWVPGSCGACGSAIELWSVGDVRIDSVNFRDNFAGALEVWNARSLSMYGDSVSGSYRNADFYYLSEVPPAVSVTNVPWVRLRKNVITEVDNSGVFVAANSGDSVTLDSNTVRTVRASYSGYSGSGIGIYGVQVLGEAFPADTAPDGRVLIRDNAFKGTGRPDYYLEDNTVVVMYLPASVVVQGNSLDSTGRVGVRVEAVDTAIVQDNTLTAAANGSNGEAVVAYGARYALVQANAVTCGALVDATYGIRAGYANADVLGNTVRGCRYGVQAYDLIHYSSPHVHGRLTVRGNSLLHNGAQFDYGVSSTGPTHPPSWEIVGNTIAGAIQAAIIPTPDSSTSVMRIDSNTVTSDTLAGALSAFPEREGIVVPFALVDTTVIRGNTVMVGGNGGIWADGRHVVWIEQNAVTARKGRGLDLALSGATGVRARVAGNTFEGNLSNGMRVARSDSAGSYDSLRIAGNTFRSNGANGLLVDSVLASFVFIDSNLAVSNALAGVRLHRPATGSYNSIRRNTDGLVYQGSGSGVVFQSNNFEDNTGYGVRNLNADTVMVDAINSWWGDAVGPACDATSDWGCDASSTGDSLTSFRVLHSPSATDTVAGTPVGGPPAPAPRVAPAADPSGGASLSVAPVTSVDDPAIATTAPAASAAPLTGRSPSGRAPSADRAGGGGGGGGTPARLRVKRSLR